MLKFSHALCAAVVFVGTLCAAPPDVPKELPAKPGKPVLFDVKIEAGKQLGWAPGFDKNRCPVVRLHSDDPATLSFMAIPDETGDFYVTFWTVGEGKFSQTVIKVGGAPVPPPVDPVDPQPPPPSVYYFLVIRADGPADPAFTKAMGLPAWAELRKKGHQFKDKTVSAAAADLNLTLPPGTALPCVVTLSVAGGASKIVRGPVALPTTDAGVAALPEGVK